MLAFGAVCLRDENDDEVILCDSCDRGFHRYCLGYETIPEGDWFCADCTLHGPSAPAPQQEAGSGNADASLDAPAAPTPQARTSRQSRAPSRRTSPEASPGRLVAPPRRRAAAASWPQQRRQQHQQQSHPQQRPRRQARQPGFSAVPGRRTAARVDAGRHTSQLPPRPTVHASSEDVSAVDSDSDSAGLRREALERHCERLHREATSLPARRAAAENRRLWDAIRAGTADFADAAPVIAAYLTEAAQARSGASRHRRSPTHAPSLDGEAGPQQVANSASTPHRRQMRPHERPAHRDRPQDAERGVPYASSSWAQAGRRDRSHSMQSSEVTAAAPHRSVPQLGSPSALLRQSPSGSATHGSAVPHGGGTVSAQHRWQLPPTRALGGPQVRLYASHKCTAAIAMMTSVM